MASSGTISGGAVSNHYKLNIAWSASQNGQNSSNMHVTVSFWTDWRISLNSTSGYVTVNGTKRTFSTGGLSGSKTLLIFDQTVTHNSDGTKGFTITGELDIGITLGGVYVSNITCAGAVSLDTIVHGTPGAPEWGPTVSPSAALPGVALSIAWGGGGGMGSNASFDHCEVDRNNNGTWADLKNVSGFSTTDTMPNYPGGYVQYRARVWNNYGKAGPWVTSASISCLGASTFSSVSNFGADDSTVSISYNVTVHNSGFVHDVSLINAAGTTIASRSKIALTNGANTLTLTAAERDALLAAMPSATTQTVHMYIITYNGTTNIGNSTSADFTASTDEYTSGPQFSNSDGFTYLDANSVTAAITGNNQVLVQNYSSLTVTPYAATLKNHATIKSYQCKIANATVSNTTGAALAVGAITQAGTIDCIVTITDSRNYTVSVTKQISIASYAAIAITTASSYVKRNGYGTQSTLVTVGTLSQILVGTTNKNALQTLKYRFKISTQADTAYSAWTNLSPTTTATTFTLNNTDLLGDSTDTHGFLAANSYTIQVQATDKLTTYIATFTLPQAIPLVTFTNGKLGVNQPSPVETLDVAGNVKISGYLNVTSGPVTDFNLCLTNREYNIGSGSTIPNGPYTGAIYGKLRCYVNTGTIQDNSTNWIWQYFDSINGQTYKRMKLNGNYFTPWLNLNCPAVNSVIVTTCSDNPGVYNASYPDRFKGGTWVAWGSGRVPVGVNASDSNFNTVEQTGGSDTQTTYGHMHSLSASGAAQLNWPLTGNVSMNRESRMPTWTASAQVGSGFNGGLSGASVNSNGGIPLMGDTDPHSDIVSVLQPYITCYMWKRTA